jgi:hypothetical protein
MNAASGFVRFNWGTGFVAAIVSFILLGVEENYERNRRSVR